MTLPRIAHSKYVAVMQIQERLIMIFPLSSSDSILDYNNGRWLLKYEYKDSYNVILHTGDLHVMNKRSLLDIADKL